MAFSSQFKADTGSDKIGVQRAVSLLTETLPEYVLTSHPHSSSASLVPAACHHMLLGLMLILVTTCSISEAGFISVSLCACCLLSQAFAPFFALNLTLAFLAYFLPTCQPLSYSCLLLGSVHRFRPFAVSSFRLLLLFDG